MEKVIMELQLVRLLVIFLDHVDLKLEVLEIMFWDLEELMEEVNYKIWRSSC